MEDGLGWWKDGRMERWNKASLTKLAENIELSVCTCQKILIPKTFGIGIFSC